MIDCTWSSSSYGDVLHILEIELGFTNTSLPFDSVRVGDPYFALLCPEQDSIISKAGKHFKFCVAIPLGLALMEDDDLRIQRSSSSLNTAQLAMKQAGRKSTTSTSRDRSIDREQHPVIFARKSSASSPHSTIARKVTLTPQHQPVFRSKGVRPRVSSDQNTSIGPAFTATNHVRRPTVSNELPSASQKELHSSQISQNPGSQASSLILRTHLRFKC
jgi:hypothetical protein